MSKQDTWDALSLPVIRTCETCKFMHTSMTKSKCQTCSWILSPNTTKIKDCDFDGWEWDRDE